MHDDEFQKKADAMSRLLLGGIRVTGDTGCGKTPLLGIYLREMVRRIEELQLPLCIVLHPHSNIADQLLDRLRDSDEDDSDEA